MENKRKHLEMIQAVINRMASNLFFLKGWAITLISALLALSANSLNYKYIIIAYLSLFVFWILDGYFLSQERKFRLLYDDTRKLDDNNIDFSMDTTKYRKEINCDWLSSIFSHTLIWFYAPMLIVVIIITFLIQ
jgi:hypothetical protein